MADYDFVIIGSGTGGSVLASRLSEVEGTTVLVLESGTGSLPDDVDIPSHWPQRFFSEMDWGFLTTPQPALGNRQIYCAVGKGVGGSTNLYHTCHVRGAPADFDNWAYNGCPGWAWQDVLPYLRKLENQQDSTSPLAGHGGPINVISAKHEGNPLSRAFIDSAVQLGYPFNDDFTANLEGAGWHLLDMKDGKRSVARNEYLEPSLKRPGVTLSPNSHATRLLFEGTRCVGVAYLRDGKEQQVRARREVLVCAGGVLSPQLLMLSGIGPADHLREHGISVLVDSPGVGQNVHDHVLVIGPTGVTEREAPEPKLNLSECCVFCKSDPGWPLADLQLGFLHHAPAQFQEKPDPKMFTGLPGLVRPLSRGSVRLASADPTAKPLVDPAYLREETDARRLVYAFEVTREIMRGAPFQEWGAREVLPGPDVKTSEQVLEYVRQNASSYWHFAGGCRMGTDNLTVVDPHLRVNGVEGLRVVDGSVMPTLPAGNCQTAILMVAERAADFIKQETRGGS